MNKKAINCLLLITLFIISGCSIHHKEYIEEPISIQFSYSQNGVIKAMTFNIRTDTFLDGMNRWNNRKDRVVDTLADNAADVIGLQEAENHQVKQIQQALSQYKNYSAGRNDGEEKGESCAVFYRKDRFELKDCGTFWFSDTPSKPGSKDWGNLWPRICSWVYLKEKGTDNSFYVYNVHLDNFSQNSRKKSVELLAKRIASRRSDDPFIVMGDFNMDISNSAMIYLQNANLQTPYPRIVSACQSLNLSSSNDGTRHNFRGGTSGPKIDHISTSEDAVILGAKIDRRKMDGRYPSDHFPVIAKLLLNYFKSSSSQ